MAELHQKRLRDEASTEDSTSSPKRQKPPYESILDLLDGEHEDDGDPGVDLSAILTSFQQELESPSSITAEIPQIRGESEAESVMRRLLEASDDELGIPNGANDYVDAVENDIIFRIDENALWELEDDDSDFCAVQQQFPEEDMMPLYEN